MLLYRNFLNSAPGLCTENCGNIPAYNNIHHIRLHWWHSTWKGLNLWSPVLWHWIFIFIIKLHLIYAQERIRSKYKQKLITDEIPGAVYGVPIVWFVCDESSVHRISWHALDKWRVLQLCGDMHCSFSARVTLREQWTSSRRNKE